MQGDKQVLAMISGLEALFSVDMRDHEGILRDRVRQSRFLLVGGQAPFAKP